MSVYRFWRDIGYAVGALSPGIIADLFGISWAIGAVGALTFLSGAVVAVSMQEKRPGAVLGQERSEGKTVNEKGIGS